MWRCVPASVIGSSHEQNGTPCQDACESLRLNTGDEELLLVAIADGAGSAKLSHVGSIEATRHLLSVVRQAQPKCKEITQAQARQWMQEVLTHLASVAEREGTPISQLACTLLLAIVSKDGAVFAQIGDGGWVVQMEDGIRPGTWPQNGEFANITTFITTEAALDTLQFVRLDGKVSGFAGFTDGIQTLALNFGARQAHAPFFKPMFDAVRACGDETELIAPLRGFLASESVTSRTDDDKTLVLACWREPEGVPHEVVQ